MSIGMQYGGARSFRLNIRVEVGMHGAEGYISVAVCLHLLGVEVLNETALRFQPLDHFGAIRPGVGKKVDKSHGARLADVHIRRSGAGIVAKLVRIPLVRQIQS